MTNKTRFNNFFCSPFHPLYSIGSVVLVVATSLSLSFFTPNTSDTLERISESSSSKWRQGLKNIDEVELEGYIKKIIQNDSIDTKSLDFASTVLCELHVRKYAKTNAKDLKTFRELIQAKGGVCLAGSGHCIETAGIKEIIINPYARKMSILHPYSQDAASLKIFSRWEKSESLESLEQYIIRNVSDEDKKALARGHVLYIGPKQDRKYLVTFSSKKIKIGGKIPKNGKYIFALSSNGKKMLAGVKKKGSFHHSSFFSSLPVQCAGNFSVENGKITKIVLESGHYKPTEFHGEKLREFLSRKECLGKSEAKNLEIIPYHFT